jgi:DNA-3-methyladenine glycosylase
MVKPRRGDDLLPDGRVGEVVAFAREELAVSAPEAARRLLGALLVHDLASGDRIVARIVETEAYREDDPASHSYRGLTARTAPMFEVPGTAYVYRSYGIHWCVNVSVEPAGIGAAVLLRAARVIEGVEVVRGRRGAASDVALLRGPGNLTQGLGLDGGRHDGLDLLAATGPLLLARDGWRPPADAIVAGPRVGVTQAPDLAWRFRLDGVAEVSSYRRSPRAVER